MAVTALRESLQRGDAPSIAAVLRDLAESSTRDVQSFQRENGTAVVLACILTHLKLEELLLVGNPIFTEAEEPNAEGSDYRLMVLKRVPQLMKLDGIPVTSEEREKAATFEPAPEE